MELFHYIDFETLSNCNRRCPTCIRNSHPDRDALKAWFEPHYLPIDVIKAALDQCVELGFRGGVCLSHYNEPTMDERLADIADMVKSYNWFSSIHINTNGDFMTEELAARLDGVLDRVIMSLYMKDPVKSERAKWVRTLFHKTALDLNEQGIDLHIPTHFSPNFPVKELAEKYIDNDCKEPAMRVIINHRQQYILCCEDVIGNFGLPTFPEMGIGDYWFNSRRTEIQNILSESGGRRKLSYCASCPRT